MFATRAMRLRPGSGIPGMSVKVFEAQLDELSRQYTFVTWPDVRAALNQGKSLAKFGMFADL